MPSIGGINGREPQARITLSKPAAFTDFRSAHLFKVTFTFDALIMVPVALAAAEELAEEGVSVEVVDPRVLVPFDKETMKASVRKTGRLVITHEAPVRGGIGGEIAAVAAEECFADLKAPVRRCAGKNAPIAPGNLEYYLVPHDRYKKSRTLCPRKRTAFYR